MVDATWFDGEAYAARVAFLRGKQTSSWSQKMKSLSPAQAEASALLLPMKIAIKNSWNNVVICSDAKLVVQSFNKKLSPPWELQTVLLDMFQLESSFFLFGSQIESSFDSLDVTWIAMKWNTDARTMS